MKKAILLVIFILVTFNFLSAQPQQLKSVSEQFSRSSHFDNDSLLFDGEFGTKQVQSYSGYCLVRVKYAYGKTLE